MNWNIIGHQHIVSYLAGSIKSGRLAHAFLFYGPKQVGKREVARQFARALLCFEDGRRREVSKTEIPCGQCQQCVELNKGTHPDFYWLEKGRGEKNISVEQIRDLRLKLAERPFLKSYKIVVITNADEMSLGAANALLKTLEEPSPQTLIILVTERAQGLPKTVLSRTQKIKFLPVSKKDIYDYLVKQRQTERDLAKYIVDLSAGRPGRAILFADKPELWQKYIQNLNLFFRLLSARYDQRIKFSQDFLDNQDSLTAKVELLLPLLNLWQLLFRDILLFKFSISDKIINSKASQELEKISRYFEVDKLIKIDRQIELTKQYLKQNINPRLAFENLLLEF